MADRYQVKPPDRIQHVHKRPEDAGYGGELTPSEVEAVPIGAGQMVPAGGCLRAT